MNRRKKILIPIAIALVVLTVITLTVPAVAQTIKRWIGYIPGFGLVHEVKLRKLDEPQEQKINGVTLRIAEVVASSDKTLVKYSLSGVEDSMKPERLVCPLNNSIPLDAFPIMKLSDGSKLQDVGLGVFPAEGLYQFEATYPPIPSTEQEVVFSLECLWQTGNGSSLWSFEVPLRLVENTDDELIVAPVIVIPTQTEQKVQDSPTGQPSVKGNLMVSQVIPLEDGYIIQGSLTVEPESGLTANGVSGYLEDVTIRDANDIVLMPSMAPNDFMIEGNSMESNQFNWAMQVNASSIAWPLTITVNSVPGVTEPYALSTFQVDVGENPQSGQEWIIDKDVPLGSKMVHVVSLKRVQGDFGIDGYEFTFTYDSSLEFSFQIAGADATGGGGQGGAKNGDPMMIARSYRGNVPVGILVVQLTGRGVEPIRGPWQVILDEPVQ